MTDLPTIFQATRRLGLKSMLLYASYQLKLGSGWLRWKTPVGRWDERMASVRAPVGRPFPLGIPKNLGEMGESSKRAGRQAIAEGEAVLEGRFRLFGSLQVNLGYPPAWDRCAPLAGAEAAPRVPAVGHWSEIALDELPADVKLLWEASRFGWVFCLGRAYRWSEDDRFARGCWELLDSWTEANRPNAGPHWASAQEVAFRGLALCFARGAFWPWLERDPGRDRWLAGLVAAHARRIPPTLDYSRAQGNNHLLSEAVALYTAGVAYPEQREARRWRRLGRSLLIQGLRGQIFEDGGYVQHSMNYARLAIQLGLWGARAAQLAGSPLPRQATDPLKRLAKHLACMADENTGEPPNFGPNDGTYLLPLTASSYHDFRPSLQLAAALLDGVGGLEPGPWDELPLWFGLDPSRVGGEQDGPSSFTRAGLHLSEGQGTRVILRAVDFQGRPGHSDQLHADIWWHGRNVALDAGTYLYNGDPPWANGLADAMVHNTVTLDGHDPMRKAGPFLWLDWTTAKLAERIRGEAGRLELLTADHEIDPSRQVRHRRTIVRIAGAQCLVIDDLLGSGAHSYLLSWLMPDGKWTVEGEGIRLQLPEGLALLRVEALDARHSLYRGGERIHGQALSVERPQWGWWSPTYAQLEPALQWMTVGQGRLPLQLRSWWTFGGRERGLARADWDERGAIPRLRRISYEGAVLDL